MTLINLVGYDYPQAIRKLNQRMTYEQIARAIGYDNRSSIAQMMNGAIPSHKHGEALWALYRNTFGEKPAQARPIGAGALKQTRQFLSSA